MIPWWWLIIVDWVGTVAGFFTAAMMAAEKEMDELCQSRRSAKVIDLRSRRNAG